MAAEVAGERAERRMTANQLFNAGVRALKAEAFADCERILRKVLRRKRMKEAYANLAFCLHRQGPDRFDEALGVLDEGIRRRPDVPELRLGRGLLFLKMTRTSSARAELSALESSGSPLAEELRAQLEGEDVHPRGLTFEAIPSPRAAPLGIFGN